MKLLNSSYAELFYSNLLEIYNNSNDTRKQTRSYGNLLNEILDSLLSEELQSFQSMLAKILFLEDKYPLEKDLVSRLKEIYVFISQANRNKKIIPTLSQCNYIFNGLARLVEEFSGLPKPNDNGNIPESEVLFEQTESKRDEGVSEAVKVIVQNVEVNNVNGKINYILLTGIINETKDKIKVVIENTNSYLSLYVVYLTNIKKYSKIIFFNLRPSQKTPNTYLINTGDYFVIEPDYLLDVSDISGCFTPRGPNPKIFFLDKLFSASQSDGMVRGSLVNTLLDLRIIQPESDFEELFAIALEKTLLKISTLPKENLLRIKNEIEYRHFPQIIRFADYVLGLKEKGNISITIEPTFYSDLHGLQGRLDVLIEHQNNATKKEIVELKSGSPPNTGTWISDMMQAVGYDLMLQSVFGKERDGTNNIMYSASENNVYRNVIRDKTKEVSFCQVRNMIVLEIFNQAAGDFSLYDKFDIDSFGLAPTYLTKNIQTFYTVFKALNLIEKKYFFTYLQFTWNELIAVKLGVRQENGNQAHGFSALWNSQFEDKFANFSVLGNLNFVEYCNDLKEYIFEFDGEATNFRNNDIGIIYKYNPDETNPLKQQIYKCAVKKIEGKKVNVSLRGDRLTENMFNQNDLYCIEHDLFDNNYYSIIKSLFNFISVQDDLKKNLLGINFPVLSGKKSNILLEETDIKHYVDKAYNAPGYFLLQGPPGTGKTSSFLIHYINKVIANNSNSVIMVVTFTNRALEEIIKHLKTTPHKFVLFSSTIDEIYSFKTVLKQNYKDTLNFDGVKICLATVSSYLLYRFEINYHFKVNHLVVDEASQILEAQLIGIIADFEKFVLIGDQNQLPAISVQDDKYCIINDNELTGIGIKNLKDSYFERMFNLCKANNKYEQFDTLKMHYRMHNEIADLINHNYENKLVCGTENQFNTESLFSNSEDLLNSRVLFFDISNNNGFKYEKYAKDEAILVNRLISKLSVYLKDIDENTFGVISPWRAQVSQIKNELSGFGFSDIIQVDTVERYQGSEKRIIIISFSVTNSTQIDRLSSFDSNGKLDRKLNVALSRAQEYLFLIGNSKLLSMSNQYKILIDKIKQENKFVAEKNTRKLLI